MTDAIAEWKALGAEYDWSMPAAPWWKRLPIIRHIRTLWIAYQVERHYAYGFGSIGLRSGYDDWVLWGMWRGLDRAAKEADE